MLIIPRVETCLKMAIIGPTIIVRIKGEYRQCLVEGDLEHMLM